jgi:hypothetical protein
MGPRLPRSSTAGRWRRRAEPSGRSFFDPAWITRRGSPLGWAKRRRRRSSARSWPPVQSTSCNWLRGRPAYHHGVVLCSLPGSLRARTGLGEPRMGRNFASELEDAGCPLEFAAEPSAGVTSVEVFGAQLGTTSCTASATRVSSRRDFTPSFLKIDRR